MISIFLIGAAAVAAQSCPGQTTLQEDACLSAAFDRSNARLSRYVGAAQHRYKGDVARQIAASERAFEAYRSAECNAVYHAWQGGTIRGAMDLSCQIRLTDGRTHDIWRNWLTYPDSTPPILPEPPLTRR